MPTNIHKRSEQQLLRAIDYAARNGTTIILTSGDAAILCNIIGEEKMMQGGNGDDTDKLYAEER